MKDVKIDTIRDAFTALLEEIHVGPPDPKMTWITTNTPDSGMLGTLGTISAEIASRPPGTGLTTIAAHASHLLFALRLACKGIRDPNVYKGVDWTADWRKSAVDEKSWEELKSGLKRAHEELLAALGSDLLWGDDIFLKGMIAHVGHGAYHLGAIRQILRAVSA
jgi:hypothetical protein